MPAIVFFFSKETVFSHVKNYSFLNWIQDNSTIYTVVFYFLEEETFYESKESDEWIYEYSENDYMLRVYLEAAKFQFMN